MEVCKPKYDLKERVLVMEGRCKILGTISRRLFDIERGEWLYSLIAREWDLYPESVIHPISLKK